MHRKQYLDNINYGNSSVGEIEDYDVNYGNNGNTRPNQNTHNNHCNDNPNTKNTLKLENLPMQPVDSNNKLYQFNGELYFPANIERPELMLKRKD